MARWPTPTRSARRSTASTPSSTWRRGPGSTTRCATRSGRSRPTSPGRSACSRRPGWRGSAGSCSPRRTPRPATTRHRATRPTSPTPSRPYGASKLAIEAYCQAYAATFGLAACSLRFSNAYGPYSLHKRSVVAAWLRAALAGRPIEINGDGRQTRDFVHADDLAAAVEAVLDAPEADVAGELFQAGTGVETTVAELADEIGRAVGRPVEIRHGPARAGDVERNVARVDKAATVLGYRARVPLADGLAGTAAWFAAALEDPALAAVEAHAASGSE